MAQIKTIEKQLHPTVVKRKRGNRYFCEIIVRYKDPDTGKYSTKSEITPVLWNGSDKTKDYVLMHYGTALVQKVENILAGMNEDERPDITFAAYMDMWLKWREEKLFRLKNQLSEETIRNNRNNVAIIKPYFQNHPILLRRLREQHIDEFMENLRVQGKSNSYIRIKVDVIDQILRRAVKDKYIDTNPMDHVDKPRRDIKPEKEYLTVDQLRTLLDRVKGNDIEPFVYIMVYLGLRISEALGLAWDDVDFESNIIHIRRALKELPETGKYSSRLKSKRSHRDMHLPSGLRDYLLRLKEKQAQDREFCGNCYKEPEIDVIIRKWNGWALKKSQWRAKFRQFMARQSDMPYITPHGLRHSFNAALLEADISDIIRAKNMGDTVKTLTNSYDHVSDHRIHEAMDIYDRMLTQPSDSH